jgi:8-hydroxy-5-deazaflavin:NADPH oxidoreductase
MRVAVLGAGSIGMTIGGRLADAGHDVVYGVRDPGSERYADLADRATVATTGDALQGANAVLFAVPGAAVSDLLDTQGAALEGTIVIDATNSMGRGAMHRMSLFEERVPGAHVFRAFNTLGWENFADPVIDGERADLFYAGPATDDRASVERLIADVGLRPVYVGEGVAGADVLDGLTRLWFTLALQQGHGRRIAFRTLGLGGGAA